MSSASVITPTAFFAGAPRPGDYRSHSGHYGIVNSESGYQNLRRFLFGERRITATLQVDELPLAKPIQEKKDAGSEIKGSYYFDVASQVRGAANYYLNERRYAQASSILKTYDELTKEKTPVYLFTGYLLEAARRANDTALMFSIDFGIRVPAFEVDRKFWFDEHFEGFLYQESITFAVRRNTVRYGLASFNGLGAAPTVAYVTETNDGARELGIALATRKGALPGFQGKLMLRVESWNAQA
jgi:hypothetical protein